MDGRIKEAVDLFQEVLVYGTERVIKSVDHPLWKEYSPEQIQMLKLIGTEQQITSSRLAVLQAVHKSAISSRIKKLLQKEVIQVVQTADKREKLLELTDKGQALILELDQVLTDYIEKLMSENIADEEIDQFLTIFRKLKTIIKMDGV
ncbi:MULTISPECIES: winged helix DNA-binding protein [Planococcus]|uniref:MarR family transcriptional regulator n=2 Tax=Planococcus TaxID=1372 RepID=A0ABM5WZS9_9BACL|nr:MULTISPECIES: winged helix DNA-binding protein [Planococcus]ALS79842.1 MarR family transcriptional regulator [Planococcus kocurii]AQU78170.1 MarR family transcriptional regulator [Planococcus faecalis]KAA0957253.1 MarR family transcriptional regulator [Planococcus sp. ANT_H30]MDJ0331194.1 winged helix DNA-binding protein [Planococcus sp. S3-L1]OHX53771.1 MarR family transcriptional regulator [Planococcus faecalis]